MEKPERNSVLAMLVVATALTRIGIVHTRPYDEGEANALIQRRNLFSEDDMTPDFTEQLGSHDHERDIKKRNHVKPEKYYVSPQKKNEEKISTTATGIPSPQVPVASIKVDDKKRTSVHNDEVDVVDREDHVTQYLADLLVNTDSEITSLQATETEEDRENLEVREDQFFAFLTGQEKILEVEGAWSRPLGDDVKNEDKYLPNLLIDEE